MNHTGLLIKFQAQVNHLAVQVFAAWSPGQQKRRKKNLAPVKHIHGHGNRCAGVTVLPREHKTEGTVPTVVKLYEPLAGQDGISPLEFIRT